MFFASHFTSVKVLVSIVTNASHWIENWYYFIFSGELLTDVRSTKWRHLSSTFDPKCNFVWRMRSRHLTRALALSRADLSQINNELRKELQRLTSTSNLQCFVVVSITLQVTKKIASCNRAFSGEWTKVGQNWNSDYCCHSSCLPYC